MTEQVSAQAGFSTLEVLVAFLVLSFGLTLSVQSIAQASLSARQARLRNDSAIALRKTLTEELPGLIDGYRGGVQMREGPSWRIELRPLTVNGKGVAVRAIVQLTDAQGKDTPHFHVEVVPIAGENASGL